MQINGPPDVHPVAHIINITYPPIISVLRQHSHVVWYFRGGGGGSGRR